MAVPALELSVKKAGLQVKQPCLSTLWASAREFAHNERAIIWGTQINLSVWVFSFPSLTSVLLCELSVSLLYHH